MTTGNGPAEPTTPVETLVRNHRRFLAFVERRTGDRESAEEILQDAFVRGMERAGSVRDDESVVAWFYRVLRNALVDRHRRRGADARARDELARRAAAEADQELERQACACIAELVPLLHPDYADLIRRVDVDGQAISDVAAATGASPGTARERMHAARADRRGTGERTCRTNDEHDGHG